MDALLKVVQTINFYLSDYILIFLLVGVGLFFSIRTRFVQIRCFGEGMRKVFGNLSMNGKTQRSGLSSFQALTTAVAAQVGTGNIVGACGAILIGGPGAIFWMWLIAFFGMATIYAEAVLAQKTRVVSEDGTVSGGPVYYIKTVFRGRFGKILAGFFSVADHSGAGLHGHHGAVQLHQRGLQRGVQHSRVGHRSERVPAGGADLHRRPAAHRSGDGKARAHHGGAVSGGRPGGAHRAHPLYFPKPSA